MENQALELSRAAAAVYAAARSHKRAAAQHRRQAQELMAEFDRLRETCRQAGIHIRTDTDPQRKGGQSHG